VKRKRKRITRSFPASTFDEALEIPVAIQKYAAGQKVRRVTLFDHLKKSPDSGSSRQLITNASKYWLIKGSYHSEYLELTSDGAKVTNTETLESEKIRAKFNLAIARIKPLTNCMNNIRIAGFLRQMYYKTLFLKKDTLTMRYPNALILL
jgi:hypothetical protein